MADKTQDDTLDYGTLMHDAMLGLIREVLTRVERDGLPGEHHFFISFATGDAGVELADWLRDRFPDTMTIVMQHWFDDLEVGPDGFGITLSFNDQPEHLYIPYNSIRNFIDPSVEFALKFESSPGHDTQGADTDAEPADTAGESGEAGGKDAPDAAAKDDNKPAKDAEVVSLDAFRK